MRSSGEVLLERVGRAELGKVLDHGEKARGYAAAIAVSSTSSSSGGGVVVLENTVGTLPLSVAS